MKLQTVGSYVLVLMVYKVSSESRTSKLDVDKVNELKDEILERVVSPDDAPIQIEVKSKLVDYLVDTTIEDYQQAHRRPRQEDGDGGGDGAEVPENRDVINGVRRILQNVFRGNLVGVIQESVSIRSPALVQTFFADIMGAFFGSNAVKGAGTIGLPQKQNATLNATDPALAALGGTGTAVGGGGLAGTAALPNANAPTTAPSSEPDDGEDENDDL